MKIHNPDQVIGQKKKKPNFWQIFKIWNRAILRSYGITLLCNYALTPLRFYAFIFQCSFLQEKFCLLFHWGRRPPWGGAEGTPSPKSFLKFFVGFVRNFFSQFFLVSWKYFGVWYATLFWCADRSVLRGLGAALRVILGHVNPALNSNFNFST